MPTYEYLCSNCEHAFEKFQSITANPLKKCPECGKMKLQRLIGTGAGIIFKGSGFYQTDYRSESYKQDQKNAKPKKATESKKDAPKTEVKTDTKPKTEKTKPKSDSTKKKK